MKKNWAAEANNRISRDSEIVVSALITQRAIVSDRTRKMYKLSKTKLRESTQAQTAWLQRKTIRSNIVELVLERYPLLGKLVNWLCKRLAKEMDKPVTMKPVSGATPFSEMKSMKGAADVPESAGQDAEPTPQARG